MKRPRLATLLLLGACGQAASQPAPDAQVVTPVRCGDGIAAGAEDCDGGDLRGLSCVDFAFNSGTLLCLPVCVYDLRGCATVPQVCGDGQVTGTEQCDDGNHDRGDCCDECRAEAGCELEDNGRPAVAPVLALGADGSGHVKGQIRPEGDLDVFAVVIPAGMTGTLTAEVVGGAFTSDCYRDLDSALELLDGDGRIVAHDDDSGRGTCSRVTAAGLAPGRAYVRVAASSVGASVPTFDYELAVTLALAPCGDGKVQAGQECDDGNLVAGDGCSSACRWEPVVEREPDDTAATAGGPLRPPFVVLGDVGAPGSTNLDPDWYAVDLAVAGRLRVVATDADHPDDCSALSADVLLFAGGGATLLETGAVGGGAVCSSLTSAALAAGRYHILVQSRPSPAHYRLVVTPADGS